MMSVALAQQYRLFRVKRFIDPQELESNDSSKLPILQELNNAINTFF